MKKHNSLTKGEVDPCRLCTYQITLSHCGSGHLCICAFFLVTTFFDIRTFVHKISGLKMSLLDPSNMPMIQNKDIDHVFIQRFISGNFISFEICAFPWYLKSARKRHKKKGFESSGIRVSSWRDGWQNTHRISPWALIAHPTLLKGLNHHEASEKCQNTFEIDINYAP